VKTTTKTMAFLLAIAVAAGCATSKRRYQDEQMDFGSISRVAVLPMANLTREPAAAERVRDVFSNALMATHAVYVVPPGEVARAMGRSALGSPGMLNTDDVVKLGTTLKVEAVITGVLKEYGEMRSGSASSNYISLSVQMLETATGKVVWSASSSKGGLSVADRLLGSTGGAMNEVTDKAVDDLIGQLFK
jgi:hypothetical protein